MMNVAQRNDYHEKAHTSASGPERNPSDLFGRRTLRMWAKGCVLIAGSKTGAAQCLALRHAGASQRAGKRAFSKVTSIGCPCHAKIFGRFVLTQHNHDTDALKHAQMAMPSVLMRPVYYASSLLHKALRSLGPKAPHLVKVRDILASRPQVELGLFVADEEERCACAQLLRRTLSSPFDCACAFAFSAACSKRSGRWW
jgi:hypothetical protein